MKSLNLNKKRLCRGMAAAEAFFCRNGINICLSSVADVDRSLSPMLDREYLTVATHCQYSYPDYKWYQPDHWDKILRVCQLLHESGYTFIYSHELIRQ